jgi:hypothetical protein
LDVVSLKRTRRTKPDRVVVLTYPIWRTAFGGNPNVIGQQINISAKSHTVIGVMPPGWKFPIEDEHIEYVLPLQYIGAQTLNNRGSHFLSVVGRLKSGVQIEKAEAS